MSADNGLPETFLQKLKRKVINDPLVPLGALVTAAFLGFGLRSFRKNDAVSAQKMMRGRVLAQAFTVVALVAGGVFQFNLMDTIPAVGTNSKTIETEKK